MKLLNIPSGRLGASVVMYSSSTQPVFMSHLRVICLCSGVTRCVEVESHKMLQSEKKLIKKKETLVATLSAPFSPEVQLLG